MGRLEEQLGAIVEEFDYDAWRRVPGLVVALYKEAAPAATRLAAWAMPAAGPLDRLWWHPGTRTAWAHVADVEKRADWEGLPEVPGVPGVALYVEPIGPPPVAGWFLVKAANGYLAPIARPGLAVQHAIGGTDPAVNDPHGLAQALVNGLIGGGLGYGAGKIIDYFLPEEHFQKGRLPTTLGLAGAGIGAVPGIWKWTAQRRAQGLGAFPGMEGAGRPPGPTDTLAPPRYQFPPHKPTPVHIWEPPPRRPGDPPVVPAPGPRPGEIEPVEPWKEATAALNPRFRKAAQDYGETSQTGAMFLRTIPVDAFNNAVWNDVANPPNAFGTRSPWGTNEQPLSTPPYAAAAVTGLVSGTGAAAGSPVVSPFQVATAAAVGAGKGWATGLAAGKILGVLAGLRPEAQQKLQDVGLWGGLITGVANSLFR